MKVVVLSRRSSGVLFGTVLSFVFWSSFWGSLLLQCGDVEMNPGPGPPKQIQTRLSSSGVGGKAGTPPLSDPSLADLMEKLNGMDSRMNEKLDGVQSDMAAIKQQFGRLQGEVDGLKKEVESLRQENQELKDHNNTLWSKVEGLEKKSDDLEGRSKRHNLIFYGLDREQNETNASCESRLQELFLDKLDFHDELPMDRVHRLGNKSDSPLIARCTFYKDKVRILKAKNKLKGTNIFVTEDFPVSVREIRKKLNKIAKAKREEGKKVTMVYDHLLMDGEKFSLDEDGVSLVKMK